MKRRLLLLADLLRADLAQFAAAVEVENMESAANALDQFKARVDRAVSEFRTAK